MRTLLQDLAQKSLKGLGTKACTNWEDRSANSLAYQVSNHSMFLCAVWLRLQSSHLMRATLHDFKGHGYASERKGWCFCIVSEHTGQDMFHLNENFHQQTLTSYFHLCVGWRGAQKMSHCHVRALLALSRVFFFFLSFLCFCYSVINFLHHTFLKYLWEGESICSCLIFPKWNTIQRRNNTWLCV